MQCVISWEELEDRGQGRYTFLGEQHGATIRILTGHAIPPGDAGPRLHRHPYEEVFVVYEGRATFTVGDMTHEATGGHIVVVPAGMPHKFVDAGEGVLRETSVHASKEVITEWLEDEQPPRAGDSVGG
jgi:mannose-6-phosphate isomerase-like protein (cupin superfamily)